MVHCTTNQSLRLGDSVDWRFITIQCVRENYPQLADISSVMSKCVGSNSCMKGNGTRILTTSSPRQRFALKNADVKVGDSVYIEVSDNTKALLTASISVQYCGANPTISTAGSSIWAETSVTSPASSQSSTRTTTTTDTPAPDTAPKPKSHSGIGSGAIAGIVVAVLLLLAAFGAFMFFLHRRRKSRIDPLRSEFAMEHSPDVDPKPLMVSAPLALNHPPSAPAASVPESVSESDAPDAMTIRRQKSLEARQRYQPSSAASAAARSQPARSESGDTATSRGHQHTFSGDSSAVASAKNRLSIGSTATMSTTRPLPTPGSVRASSVPRIEVAQESDGGRLVNVPPPTYDPSWREQDEEEERQ